MAFSNGLWTLLGFFIFFSIEKVFPDDDNDDANDDNEKKRKRSQRKAAKNFAKESFLDQIKSIKVKIHQQMLMMQFLKNK